MTRLESKELIIPFLDDEEKKIHYYDFYYGGMMGRYEEKEYKSYKQKESINRSKVKGQRT